MVADLPAPSPHEILDTLALHPRTQNCLVRFLANEAVPTRGWTVSRLLAIPGFGLRALCDVVTAARARVHTGAPSVEGANCLEDEIVPLLTARPNLAPRFPTPLLDRARIIIAALAPAPEPVVMRNLIDAGLARGTVTLAEIERATRFSAEPVPFAVLRREDFALAVPATALTLAKRIYTVALRAVAFLGLAAVDHVALHANTTDLALVRAVVSARPSFEWLDQASGWFWFRDSGSRLARTMEKLLTVASELPLATIARTAFRRRPPDLVPPVRIVKAFCQSVPRFQVIGNDVRLLEMPTFDVLSARERTLVDFLRGGPQREDDLASELAARIGVGIDALLRALRHSLLVVEQPPGTFRLVGT